MVSARASRKHGSAGLAAVRPPRRQPKERRRDTDGERCTREPNYRDAEGAERWPAALPAKARPAAPKLLTDAVFDVLPPVKHRSRAPKGYHKAATIDVAAEEDGKGAPRRKKAPGRPKKTTPRRSESASVSVPLPAECSTEHLERTLRTLPGPVAFAIGLALAELEGLHGGPWLPAPASAALLPAGSEAIAALQSALNQATGQPAEFAAKWKVGVLDPETELQLLEPLLEQLPSGAQLRLDANGGWDRATAGRWAMRLQTESKLQWLEQPLPPSDHAGLLALGRWLPVALDESLRHSSGIPSGWSGWLVHKPALEGDPRPLLRRLKLGAPKQMVSSALESGIGARACLLYTSPSPRD